MVLGPIKTGILVAGTFKDILVPMVLGPIKTGILVLLP